MREDLANSLKGISKRAAAVLLHDYDISQACRDIRDHRVGPSVFTAYFDLVHSLQVQDWARAAELWRAIGVRARPPAQLECRPFDPSADEGEILQRLFSRGWNDPQIFAPPETGDWARFADNVGHAFALLQGVSPAWRSEVEGLVTRIFAAAPPEGEGRRFAGSSSFMAWGAIFLNARTNNTRLRVLSGVVHEATHLMLFGLSRRQPLTENPPHERYWSPLRSDPRPMDGVYHATYVSGRLTLFYDLLSRHGALTDEERIDTLARVDRQKERFLKGHEVVRKDGKLSALGRELIEEAADTVAGVLA